MKLRTVHHPRPLLFFLSHTHTSGNSASSYAPYLFIRQQPLQLLPYAAPSIRVGACPRVARDAAGIPACGGSHRRCSRRMRNECMKCLTCPKSQHSIRLQKTSLHLEICHRGTDACSSTSHSACAHPRVQVEYLNLDFSTISKLRAVGRDAPASVSCGLAAGIPAGSLPQRAANLNASLLTRSL